MTFSFYFALLFTLFSLANPLTVKAIDKITDFHSDITINQDTSISIKETIKYTTDQQKHGIFRTIPFKYNQYTASIKKIDVNVPFSRSTNNGNLVLKIGDSQKTFSGNKTYEISYTLHNTILSKNKPELYLDITGEYWQIPIEKSSATIHSPYAKIISSNCYSGLINSNDKLCQFDLQNFSYSETINNGSNFTIYTSLSPNNQLIFPINYNYLKIPLALILSLLIILLWYFKGRDQIFVSPNVFNTDSSLPKKLKPLFYHERIPFVYKPLLITPGIAGTIIDQQTNNRDIIAEIIDLAHKKYLKITLIPKKGIFSKDDFLFEKLKSSNNKLPQQQKYLLDNIFNQNKSIKLSALKNTFYKYFNKSKTIITESLIKEKYFFYNPQIAKIFLIIILIIINIFISKLNTNIFIFNFIISLFIIKNFSQRTAVGHNLMLQVKGLQKTIKLGKWREKIKEKNLFIEEILPFAISLGVVNKLAKDMNKLGIAPPEYFNGFLLANHSLQSSLNSFSSTFNSQINAASGSHSSSSGGFSGGGFGGGGGGSW
jgi:uncharacterized membrane protein